MKKNCSDKLTELTELIQKHYKNRIRLWLPRKKDEKTCFRPYIIG